MKFCWQREVNPFIRYNNDVLDLPAQNVCLILINNFTHDDLWW